MKGTNMDTDFTTQHIEGYVQGVGDVSVPLITKFDDTHCGKVDASMA